MWKIQFDVVSRSVVRCEQAQYKVGHTYLVVATLDVLVLMAAEV